MAESTGWWVVLAASVVMLGTNLLPIPYVSKISDTFVGLGLLAVSAYVVML